MCSMTNFQGENIFENSDFRIFWNRSSWYLWFVFPVRQELIFICLLATCIFSLEKWLCQFFAYLIGLLLVWAYFSVLYISRILTLKLMKILSPTLLWWLITLYETLCRLGLSAWHKPRCIWEEGILIAKKCFHKIDLHITCQIVCNAVGNCGMRKDRGPFASGAFCSLDCSWTWFHAS